jgi:hypothetical protein
MRGWPVDEKAGDENTGRHQPAAQLVLHRVRAGRCLLSGH